ncbi:MAG: glycosyltransferase family 4 protein, partial [Nitrospirae bacterium]|nr:glycosyltransferase family 4 protein [Nitrospirota bacterium]
TPVSTGILTRWLYTRLADVVVTTSEAIRRTLIERNGYPAERLVAVPTHIDPAAYDRPEARAAARAVLGIGRDAFVVGTIAVLRSWKGHDLLLDAARDLRGAAPGLRIVIVGDGPQADRLRARVAKEGLSETVTMTGHREEVAELLSAMDVFVFPSTANEGVPQAVLQAMAAGLSVVASSLPSIAEVVREGETGFLFPPGDASALVGRIALLAGDADLRRRMGEAGKARVRERFSESGMLDRLEEVYGRAASGRGRGGC